MKKWKLQIHEKLHDKLQFYTNNKTINQLVIYTELYIKINILCMFYINKNSFIITIQLWKFNIENLKKQKNK